MAIAGRFRKGWIKVAPIPIVKSLCRAYASVPQSVWRLYAMRYISLGHRRSNRDALGAV